MARTSWGNDRGRGRVVDIAEDLATLQPVSKPEEARPCANRGVDEILTMLVGRIDDRALLIQERRRHWMRAQPERRVNYSERVQAGK